MFFIARVVLNMKFHFYHYQPLFDGKRAKITTFNWFSILYFHPKNLLKIWVKSPVVRENGLLYMVKLFHDYNFIGTTFFSFYIFSIDLVGKSVV